MRLPNFDELPRIDGLGLRHAWGVFGADDELGTVNLLSAERVRAAAQLVRDGTVVNLVVPLSAIDPPLFGRTAPIHTIFTPDRNTLDERLDGFYPQGSSQWDGLRHVRAREFGHWGGVTDASALVAGRGPLGVDRWVEHGFVGRGVLLDVSARTASGGPVDPFAPRSIAARDLDAAASAQGVQMREGDILCVRTGWMDAFLRSSPEARRAAVESRSFAGLAADEEMSRWLWDRHVAAVACDNPAVEVSPGDPSVGSLHRRLLPLLGIPLGELFTFQGLADTCVTDGRWEFLFVSVPLYVRGGVGSPANAIAIR